MTDRAAARFLDQATWGPTPASIESLQQMGIAKWLAAQFAATPSDLPDQPILDSSGNTNQDLAPVQAAFFQNAVNGPDQLRQRVAFILSQIWVVSQVSVHSAYAFPPYWRIFRDNAFGNYRDIIKAVTLSPAMGTYLNMANNNKANPAKGTAANENYARELMQLFTLGLTELNPDGSPVLDANNNPIPTYNQAVVTNMAKVLTGWTYPTAPGATAKTNNPAYYFGQMFAVEAEHDTTAKTIFNNVAVPAGQTAEQDLDSLLDALMQQPTMAPFVSQQLIQHLVTSNPSPAYMQRVAQVFSSTQRRYEIGDHCDSDRCGSARRRRPKSSGEREFRPSARAGSVHGEPAARVERDRYRNQLAQFRCEPNGPGPVQCRPACSVIFRRRTGPKAGCWVPSFRFTRRRLHPTGRTSSTRRSTGRSTARRTQSDAVRRQSGGRPRSARLHQLRIPARAMSSNLTQAATDAANAASTPAAKAQAALYVVLTSSEYQVIQ